MRRRTGVKAMTQRKRISIILATGSLLIALELLGLIELNQGLQRLAGALSIALERANDVTRLLGFLASLKK